MQNGFSIYADHLSDSNCMNKLKKKFSMIAASACQPQSKQATRNLWHSLTGACAYKNIYQIPLPFHIRFVRTVDESDINFTCYYLDKNQKVIGLERIEEVDDKKDIVISISANLLMQVKINTDDVHPMRKAIWEPPRDFNLLSDEPAPKCYVELALIDFTYVSHTSVKACNESRILKKPSIFEYILSNSPDLVQQTWAEFKETFLSDEEPK